MDLLPPRIADPELFALLVDILAIDADTGGTARLRLQLVDRKFSWQALADLALDQGVVPPLIWALRQRSLLLPVPNNRQGAHPNGHPTSALEGVYRRHLARRNEQRDQLHTVIAALNRANVVPLLLKGARYLVAPVGPWCEARAMRDIDLLVPRDDAPRAVEALADEGYMTETEFNPVDQHLPEMWLAGRPSVVEIHTEALSFSGRKLLTTEEVWRRGIRLSTAHGTFCVLPDEWHLLHGLVNHQVSDHCHLRRVLAVKALWEFAMLGRTLSDEAWSAIAGHMRVHGRIEVLGSILVQAERLFGLARPQNVDISPAAQDHAEATLLHAARPDWLRRGYFLADRYRHGFARETMAVRYGVAEADVTAAIVARHLRFLFRPYRGQILRRLTGGGERPF